MLHEYRTYTIHPGKLRAYLTLAGEKAIPIRRNDYGRLVGFWWSEAGMLNQVHHIWEYPSVDVRNAERLRMFDNRDWTDEFIVHAWPTMQRQDVRFMTARSDIRVPSGSNMYEARVYCTVVGRFMAVAEAVASRPRGASAQLVGVYTSDSPSPNEVVELVAYGDLQARLASHQDSDEQANWFDAHGADLLGVHSTLLHPTPFSPML